jgi:Kef-type K+ transport system membrane component KefB
VEISFDNLAIVAALGFAAPLIVGFLPWLRFPSVVFEIGLGIVVGPSVLGWVEVDEPVRIMALIGVAFVLLLAGLEVDFDQLRGRVLGIACLGFAVSFGLAIVWSYGLDGAGILQAPFLTAVILSATSLAIILPIMKDAGVLESRFGQMTIAGATIADIATVVLLSLFFSADSGGLGSRLLLFGGFALLVIAGALVLIAGHHVARLSRVLYMLQDTTAQIRVRGAFLMLLVFVVLAETLGLEAILGAFLAGAILKIADRDGMMTHSHFHRKLEEAGFGIFVPIFFVASGVRFDGHALFASSSALVKVPIFFGILLLIRGLPALLYRPLIGMRLSIASGFLQATTLGFVVVASDLGLQLGLLDAATEAALIAAAVLSVVVYPVVGLTILRGGEGTSKRRAVPQAA